MNKLEVKVNDIAEIINNNIEMNINNLHQLFESVITKLTNTLEIIDNYECQYKEYKTKVKYKMIPFIW